MLLMILLPNYVANPLLIMRVIIEFIWYCLAFYINVR